MTQQSRVIRSLEFELSLNLLLPVTTAGHHDADFLIKVYVRSCRVV